MLGQETSPPTSLQRRGEDAMIDISKLSAGMYFLQLKSESGSVGGKVCEGVMLILADSKVIKHPSLPPCINCLIPICFVNRSAA